MLKTAIVTTRFELCELTAGSAHTRGGGLNVNGKVTSTVEGSEFIECSSRHAGGALFSDYQGVFNISDTLVKDCHSGTTGAICVYRTGASEPVSFSHVYLVGNSVGDDTTFFTAEVDFGEDATKFPDIAFLYPDFTVEPTIEFEDCFTTITPDSTGMIMGRTKLESGLYDPERFFHSEFDKIGPLLTATPTARVNEKTGKIELEMEAMTPLTSQEYEVTVKDEDGTETRFRMLFSDGTGIPVSGSESNLKYNTGYTIASIVGVVPPSSSSRMTNGIEVPVAAWAFNLAATPDLISFTTQTILKASCRVGSGTNHVWIQLTGQTIAKGTYSVALTELEFSFEVTFTDARDENGHVLSTEASVRLFGDESKLSFNKEYTLKGVTETSTSTFIDLSGMLIPFSTPLPTERIVGIGTMTFTNSQKDEVSISLTGADLASTEYFIETSPSSVVDGNKLSAVFFAQTGLIVAKVFSTNDSEVPLQFNQKYEVVSITDSLDTPILIDRLSFTVPPSPLRITSLSVKLSGDKSQALVELIGMQIPTSPTLYLNLKNPTTNMELCVITSYKSDTVLVATIPAAQTESGQCCAHFEWLLDSNRSTPFLGSGEAEIYKTSKLKYDTDYTVVRLTSSIVPVSIPSTVTFKTPVGPVRILSAECDLDAESEKAAVIVLAGDLFPSKTSFKLIVYELDSSSAKIGKAFELSSSFLEDGSASSHTLSHVIYNEPSAKLKFGTSYAITDLLISGRTTIVSSDVTFDVPAEPVRIEDATSRLNSAFDAVIVTLTGCALKAGTYSFTLTHITAENSRSITGSLKSDGNVECTHTVEESNPNLLLFGETYTLTSATLDTKQILFNSNIDIYVPRPPKVTDAMIHPNTQNTGVTIELLGTDLGMMKEFKVTLRPSFSFVVLFADASRALSPSFRIGSKDGLDANTEYFVESIVGVVDSDDVILIDGPVSFTTPEATLMEVVVSSSCGVGGEGEECGSLSLPCETLLIGWEIGKKEGNLKTIILKVRDSAENGGMVVVGRGSVEVRGMLGQKGRVVISEQATTNTKSDSVFVIDGGEILLLDLIISVPLLNSVWGWRPAFVVGGKGSVIMKEVEICCSEEGEKAGIGLVGMEQGRLEVDQLFVRNISFRDGVGLIRCLGGQNEMTTDMRNVVVQNTTLESEGILDFSSTDSCSEISMTDCELDRVRMRVGEGTDTALVSIRTRQARLSISKCVFFESGCELSNGVKIGQALLITLFSSDNDETVQCVDLHSCLIVDCAGRDESGEGGVLIRSGNGLSRVSLSGSWFEERSGSSSPSSFERDAEGRMILTKQKLSFGGWKRAAVVVERGRRLPVIARKGSGFSNCGLIVRGMEVERATNRKKEREEL
ncbi:hypothetical protein BLNAU_2130 [Blattamonas nauphoetae]|uniref:Uncharacterized protein n=1 Tax=Blattamonas nauphoetae TaxID=2049346 RepID=A0ABQ9YH76_9EUKA|nr:hypothetical protein BLNAU_2130 [Blattamonas nauphoetae]